MATRLPSVRRTAPALEPDRSEMLAYLAGPITGLSFEEAVGWRRHVEERLSNSAPHVRCLDPMRGKHHLADAAEIGPRHYAHGLLDPASVVARDLWDVRRADVVVMNLSCARSASIGCMVELGWAHAHGCFVIVVLEPQATAEPVDPHDHIFVRALASVVTTSVDDAIAIVETL